MQTSHRQLRRIFLGATATAVTAFTVIGATPAGAGAAHVRPTRPAASNNCAKKTDFVQADHAELSEGKVFIHAHKATKHCGGPDDFSYNVSKKTLRDLVLTKKTVVEVLGDSTTDHKIAPSKFPAYLKHDENVRIFTVTGSHTHVTKLSEDFHP